jgi:uncharacterized protein
LQQQLTRKKTSRRRFLQGAAACAIAGAGGSLAYARFVELHWIEVVQRSLPITNLPASLDGKTLVQISDLHVGDVVDRAYITHAMDRASALKPDILAITGDFMTSNATEQVNSVMKVLENLRPGRLATVGILGNHDYGQHWSSVEAANLLTSRLSGAGIALLRNAHTDVQGLHITGIDDLWSPGYDLSRVMKTMDPRVASLVLCHNPDAADMPGWNGYRGWILSGHTHGGQCKPPFFDPPITPCQNKRYTSGEFDLFDGRRLYINRGLGYLRPVRFNARPEITVFTLRKVV